MFSLRNIPLVTENKKTNKFQFCISSFDVYYEIQFAHFNESEQNLNFLF